jgi:hypothetical protein
MALYKLKEFHYIKRNGGLVLRKKYRDEMEFIELFQVGQSSNLAPDWIHSAIDKKQLEIKNITETAGIATRIFYLGTKKRLEDGSYIGQSRYWSYGQWVEQLCFYPQYLIEEQYELAEKL